MKKLLSFLPVMALVLGGGLALATTQTKVAPQHYWDGDSWESLDGRQPGEASGQYRCIEPIDSDCTAEQVVGGVPSGVTPGTFFVNP